MFSAIINTLRLTNWLNWIVAALLTLFLIMLVVDPVGLGSRVFSGFAEGQSRAAVKAYLFAILSIVPPTAIAVHFILTRLAALVRDAAAGIAFTDTNATRLQTIGWALLAINLVDLLFGWLSVRASEATGEYFGWSLSLTGWIAVPMLFVLAHVFREGAAMREDLEGTV